MPERRFRLRGDFDLASRDELAHNLDTLTRCCGDDIAIDCSEVTFMDSTGISVLVDAQNRLMDQGRRLRLDHADHTLRRIIEVLGLATFLCLESDAPQLRLVGSAHPAVAGRAE